MHAHWDLGLRWRRDSIQSATRNAHILETVDECMLRERIGLSRKEQLETSRLENRHRASASGHEMDNQSMIGRTGVICRDTKWRQQKGKETTPQSPDSTGKKREYHVEANICASEESV